MLFLFRGDFFVIFLAWKFPEISKINGKNLDANKSEIVFDVKMLSRKYFKDF